eukprot:TRINITY_DN3064_c0_g1_i2.p1 TRINITY_DN3064_c0_g1~~TRINITY_DN3064_c0_g1_i2.p1  ORF type:complete len:223 (-),score=13.80 TRINITY_DN3064_c0_g1_i2:113-781(-)
MDINRFYDGGQAVLRIKEADGVEICALTIAGFLGLCGGNNYGVGQCCNTLSQICTSPTGLPATFLGRSILTHKTVADAISFVKSVPHASGIAYTIASHTEWASLECSANKVCDCVTEGSPSFCHTNHPLSSDDLVSEHPYVSDSSIRRLSYLHEQIASLTSLEGVTEHDVQKWLSRHPVCLFDDHNTGFTFGSIVMVLTEAAPVFYISPGPPSITAWLKITF